MTRRHFDEDCLYADDFGGGLRDARERAGLTLEEIARQTKVGASQVRALERNDLSRWPGGIFRRGFVRHYAEMVGLDPDETVAAFVQAFPESEGPPLSELQVPTPRGDPSLRLMLAEDPPSWWPTLTRMGAAATDFMAPIVLAAPSGVLGGMTLFWLVLAVVAVLYLTIGTLVLGMSPGLWMMQRASTGPRQARTAAGLRLVERARFARDAGDESALEPKISHAHR
jgi:transcriptional regulator with XRE-family HTH domain